MPDAEECSYTKVYQDSHFRVDFPDTEKYHQTIPPSEKAFLFEEFDKNSHSYKIIILCFFWYLSAIFASNLGKAVLTVYPYPVTLSLVQFLSLFTFLAIYALLNPSNLNIRVKFDDLKYVALISVSQVVGHIINSTAISFAPISLIYTVKGISPLFTIIICKVMFGTKYSKQTYISLIPLLTGIALTSFKASGLPVIGFLLAVLSSVTIAIGGIINKFIVSRAQHSLKIRDSAHLVKYKILFHTSITSIIMIIPIWLWSEGPALFLAQKYLVSDIVKRSVDSAVSIQPNFRDYATLLKLALHCTSHAAQAFFSISLISITSPVTFSICSLMKRVAVIIFAIIWVNQPITPIQSLGILLFFCGLFMYSFAKKR